jgi:uncharacterized damage-inducible protein DinB
MQYAVRIPSLAYPTCCELILVLADLSEEEQSEILREVVDTLQTPNRLLLSWLLEHMTHIVGKVHVSMHLFRPH